MNVGEFTIIEITSDIDSDKSNFCKLKCSCGTVEYLTTTFLKKAALNKHFRQSCGCYYVGKTFGKLTVLQAGVKPNDLFECICSCGNFKTCGCTYTGISSHPLYFIWKSILNRCDNPLNRRFHDYGGRGIKVCKEWYDFETFVKDMGNRPEGYSVERVDNNLGYSKSNCIWADRSTQQRNKRACSHNVSETRNINWNATRNKWKVRKPEGEHIGRFLTLEEAQSALERFS